jgi:hypothetical protein
MMTEECGGFGGVPPFDKMPTNMENDCLTTQLHNENPATWEATGV